MTKDNRNYGVFELRSDNFYYRKYAERIFTCNQYEQAETEAEKWTRNHPDNPNGYVVRRIID